MARERAFEVEGVVVEALPNRTWRVELSNGHRVLAFATGKARASVVRAAGQKVKLQMSPYDLSQGRLLAEEQTI